MTRLTKLNSSDTSVAYEKMCNITHTIKDMINSFHVTSLFLYPLKTFGLCFQVEQKEDSDIKWVNIGEALGLIKRVPFIG